MLDTFMLICYKWLKETETLRHNWVVSFCPFFPSDIKKKSIFFQRIFICFYQRIFICFFKEYSSVFSKNIHLFFSKNIHLFFSLTSILSFHVLKTLSFLAPYKSLSLMFSYFSITCYPYCTLIGISLCKCHVHPYPSCL